MLCDSWLVVRNIVVPGLSSVQVVHSVWMVENLILLPVVTVPLAVGSVLQIDLGWVVVGKIGVG